MAKKSDWATYGMMEAPYWKDGMSIEEYEAERKYYYDHIEDVKNGTYKPLWLKKKKSNIPE